MIIFRLFLVAMGAIAILILGLVFTEQIEDAWRVFWSKPLRTDDQRSSAPPTAPCVRAGSAATSGDESHKGAE